MRLILPTLVIVLAAGVASAQTTQPSTPASSGQVSPTSTAIVSSAVELRATQAFNKGDYAVALPMLQKEAETLKTDPSRADKLGMVEEQIRVCQKNTPAGSAVTSVGDANAIPTAPPQTPSTVTGADRKPHPAPKPGETLDMEIKELGNFEYDAEKNTPIPDDVKALNGTDIRLHGFMIPMDAAENISKFALVPSLFACCYGQPPQIQHTIVVTCPKGKAVSYYPDEIVVEGKLNVEVQKDDGFVVGIFSIQTSSVKPAPK